MKTPTTKPCSGCRGYERPIELFDGIYETCRNCRDKKRRDWHNPQRAWSKHDPRRKKRPKPTRPLNLEPDKEFCSCCLVVRPKADFEGYRTCRFCRARQRRNYRSPKHAWSKFDPRRKKAV